MEPKAKSLHRDCTCGVCPFLFSQQCRSHQSPFSEQLNYGWTDVWILGWQVLVMCLLAQLQGCMTSNLYGCIQPDHDVHLTLMETVKIFKVDHNFLPQVIQLAPVLSLFFQLFILKLLPSPILTCVHGPEVFLGWAVIIIAIFCYHFLSLELLHLITY